MSLFHLKSENAQTLITCSLGYQLGFQHLWSSLALTILSKNTKSNGVTPEAQLQLIVKF